MHAFCLWLSNSGGCHAGKDCNTLAVIPGVNASSCTAPTTQCLALQNLSASAYPPNPSGAVSVACNMCSRTGALSCLQANSCLEPFTVGQPTPVCCCCSCLAAIVSAKD
jgi:hypothetical protein